MKKWSSRSLIAVGLCSLIIGALSTWSIAALFFPTKQIKALRESDIASSGGYTFTDPLLGLTAIGNTNAPEYAQLQTQIQNYINSQKGNGLSSASVKFSDIEASEGFTINPDQLYDPASLTKVPLAMTYYALAEQGYSPILSDKITYSGAPNLDASVDIKPSVEFTAGQTYTVRALIEHMLRYSDNNAEQLLADHLSGSGHLDALQLLFDDLGVKINPTDPNYMSIQSYSLLLRALFNATYLDRQDSELMLKLLSESDFNSGLRAGVPGNIPIAEKFGNARVLSSTGVIVGDELHNCGIIYYPGHPYLLCIMTKGSDIPDLEGVIAQISKDAYGDIAARYGI